MLFNSWQFAVFFPVVFLLYWLLPHKYRIYVLLISSYWFYMSWNTEYVVLILFTTVISYLSAILIERFRQWGKAIMIIGLIACLGVLFVFKYFNFVSRTLSDILNVFAIRLHPMTLKLILPVGISFYTFQTLSYVIDVYRGNTQAERNFVAYAVFVSFFPQLVAGPIERTNNLLPQIKAVHTFSYDNAVYGLKLMGWGLFKKMGIADLCAVWVDGVFGNITDYTGFTFLTAAVFFSLQIYCDFSGYSDIARGCAKMMDIDLMENFRSPYFSSSLKEFWQRWHISLSTWFRDYVYIPLGGNRCSKFRHYMNLMMTFMISGLWHGADWTFVAWGTVHGAAQVFEGMTGAGRKRSFTGWLIVSAFTFLAWVLFRAQNFGDAVYLFSHMFDGVQNLGEYVKGGINQLKTIQYGLTRMTCSTVVLMIYDYFAQKIDIIKASGRLHASLRWPVYILLTIIFLSLYVFTKKPPLTFIYFQF